jgi:hypothetical protein
MRKALMILSIAITSSTCFARDTEIRMYGVITVGVLCALGGIYQLCKKSDQISSKMAHIASGLTFIGSGLAIILLAPYIIQDVDSIFR